jgi:hypothetical protein
MPRRSRASREKLPPSLKRVFWNMDFGRLDLRRDADAIIAGVVEFGTLDEVQWLIDRYGLGRIHRFFREVGGPEISDRTVAFWRAVFKAEGEPWPRPPTWRRDSSAPWVD